MNNQTMSLAVGSVITAVTEGPLAALLLDLEDNDYYAKLTYNSEDGRDELYLTDDFMEATHRVIPTIFISEAGDVVCEVRDFDGFGELIQVVPRDVLERFGVPRDVLERW